MDNPANEEPFLTLKSMSTEAAGADQGAGGITPVADKAQPDMGQPSADAAKPLSMPGKVKDALSQCLSYALDKLSGLAEQVQSAQVDESAPPPVDLLMVLDGCADHLDDCADQFAQDGSPGPGSMGEAMLSADQPTEMSQKSGSMDPPKSPESTVAEADKPNVPEKKAVSGRKARLIARKRLGVLEEAHKALTGAHGGMDSAIKSMGDMITELRGETPDQGSGAKVGGDGIPKAPEQIDKPTSDSNSAPNDGAVEKAMKAMDEKLAPIVAALAGLTNASKAWAPPQLPNAQLGEGHEAPSAPVREPTFREKLEAAKKQKSGA